VQRGRGEVDAFMMHQGLWALALHSFTRIDLEGVGTWRSRGQDLWWTAAYASEH